jgi:hypothetical protein
MPDGAPSVGAPARKLKARFAAVRVRVADGPPQRIRDKGQQLLPGDEAWLIGEHRTSGEKKYYLANLSAKMDLRTLASVIKARWICEQAHQQLKEELGLDHFEGRSWQGLHRHALFQLSARFASPTNTRPRLRSARTKFATTRSAVRATSAARRSTRAPQANCAQNHITAGSAMCEARLGGAANGNRAGKCHDSTAGTGPLGSAPRPRVRLARGVVEARQAQVPRDARDGCARAPLHRRQGEIMSAN